MRRLLPLLILFACFFAQAQVRQAVQDGPDIPRPDRTLCFAQRDTCDLLLDFYTAAPDRGPCADTLRKPVIVHVFGGAFLTGRRDHPDDRIWYRQLADAGYHVAAIDYRLGLKGKTVKTSLSSLPVLRDAIQVAVDDLFAATNYLLDHAAELGIDPDRIIVSGSSAGAITALQAEWEICNAKREAQVLPGWFNYAGIMAFSGAVFSMDGAVRFPQKPCPILLLHGTADRIVPYKQITLFGNQWSGSSALAKKLTDAGANFQIYRFRDAGHEIAISMKRNLPEELRFLEENVIRGAWRPLDALVTDSAIPDPGWRKYSARDLYPKK
ncbi:MAG: alpha/beta hydrolase [Bacteroidales bacterium]|nr:alpha/beta hydrolase [Bacteroidales bacterium]